MTDTRRHWVGATDYPHPDKPTRHIFETGYFDEPLQNQEEKVINLGKFIIQAQPKHADDLISYGMTIPGEIFVYVPSPDKPIDDNNPLCFVSEGKASEFNVWPEGVSRACFFPVYKMSVQLPGIISATHTHLGFTTSDEPSLDEPSLDNPKEINIKSLDKYAMQSLDKYLLDLQSDMLHLSEAIVAALECLRESSEENNDSFIKAYNKYRSKRGQTVLGEE